MGSAALFVLYRAEKFSYFYKLLISLNKDSDKLQKALVDCSIISFFACRNNLEVIYNLKHFFIT